MREIKFRGYCEKDSEWRYGFYATNTVVHEILTMIDGGELYGSQIDVESLGQCTGIKDANGIEIFEGDILSKDGSNYPVEYIWCEFNIDGYDNGDYYHGEDSMYHDWESFEVIGNIYENPELLK